jgi:uncharacterized RmlC-like cupin family protein
MGFVLTEKHFTTEQEAMDESAARGLHAYAVDIPEADNELHWHDFDSVTYIVSGTARVEFEDGSVMQCGAGARIEAPAGVLHREVSPAYRAVFGLAVDAAEMTRPINKLPSDRD